MARPKYGVFFAFLILSAFLFQRESQAESKNDKQQRVALIKQSCVRIAVDGGGTGSGFIVSKDGKIVTAQHVVFDHIETAPSGEPVVAFKKTIEVQLNDGTKLPAEVAAGSQGKGSLDGFFGDFAVLQVHFPSPVRPLTLGDFRAADEGADVYTCGFPLSVQQPVVTFGSISTKWFDEKQIEKNEGPTKTVFRKEKFAVAWLDLTMSRGNSGGPVMLIGKKPATDRVIGIADFILNPFAAAAENAGRAAQSSATNIIVGGFNFREFFILTTGALSNISLGVSGCISVDPVRIFLNR